MESEEDDESAVEGAGMGEERVRSKDFALPLGDARRPADARSHDY